MYGVKESGRECQFRLSNLLISIGFHASWLKMKFSFSSMLMTSWLCEKQSRPMKNLEICWSGSKIKISEAKHIVHVRVEFLKNGITLFSTPVYGQNRTYFILPQRKQGLYPNGAPFDSKKVSGISRWKIRTSFVPPPHWKFDAARYLDKTTYFSLLSQFSSNLDRIH